jgi:hypothetical protein
MAIQVTSQDAIDTHIRRAAATADVESISRAMTQQLFEELLEGHADDPVMQRAGYESVRDNIAGLFALLAGEPSPVDPGGPEAFAIVIIDAGLSSRDLERLYRRGQSLSMESWLHVAEAYAREQDIVLAPLLDQPNERIHQFLEAVIAKVLSAYDSELARRHRSREERQARLVMQLLSGELAPNLVEVDEFLDYRLAATHLAFCVRADRSGISSQAKKALLSAGGGAKILAIREPDAGHWAIWMADGQDTPELRSVLADLPLTGSYAPGGAGLHGFRLAHERATRASAAQAARGGVGVVPARDLHLATLLLADPDVARDFAALELGRLDEDSTTGARLRDTLLAYLETGSQVGAAALLDVHEHTIRNRIRQAEEMLGFSVPSRRTELELALRVREILGPIDDRAEHDGEDARRA